MTRLADDLAVAAMFATVAVVMNQLRQMASGSRWVFAAAAIVAACMVVRLGVEVVLDVVRLAKEKEK